MNKKWKFVEFTALTLATLFMIGLLVKSIFVEQVEITGQLKAYECELWKNSTVIFTHRIELDSGEKYFVRTKGIACNDIVSPKFDELVTIVVEDKTILGLKQFGEQILRYDILSKDSEKGTSIVWLVMLLLMSGATWSGFQLNKLIKKK